MVSISADWSISFVIVVCYLISVDVISFYLALVEILNSNCICTHKALNYYL